MCLQAKPTTVRDRKIQKQNQALHITARISPLCGGKRTLVGGYCTNLESLTLTIQIMTRYHGHLRSTSTSSRTGRANTNLDLTVPPKPSCVHTKFPSTSLPVLRS